MLLIAYVLNPLLMIGMPIALGVFLARRLGQPWRLFFIGAVTFVASQVVHIPMNIGLDRLFDSGLVPVPPEAYHLLFNVTLLGLTAGLCEETARYLVYRFWIKDARHWRQALMFGAGHGGIEAIITGALAGLGAINVVVLSQTDLSTLAVSPEQLAEIQQGMAVALSYPWFYPLLGATERLFAIIFHLSAAVLVLQAVRRRNLLWLVAAILWHTLLNALALYVLNVAGPYWSEASLAGMAILSLAIIFALRQPAPPPVPVEPPAPLPALATLSQEPPAVTAEALEKSRYQ
jgi:uncharacterized membrane protein YhfC